MGVPVVISIIWFSALGATGITVGQSHSRF
ncbi:hypothetical protein MZE46_029675 [Pseudomonas sp. A4]|nr:hypothetical protein [Pseudomonas sp. S11A4]